MIEMLIVITIIAILALIVIPRLMGAARKSREGSLKGDLHNIRNAIEAFEGDMAAWPPALSDVVAANGGAISAASDGNGASIDPSSYHGPYLRTPDGNLPKDPFTNAADWTYSNTNGEVHSNSTLTGYDGTAYNTW